MNDFVASLQPFAILDEIEAGIIVLDSRHVVRHWNMCMERFSGIAPSDLIGKPLWESFPALQGSLLHSSVEDALATGAPSVLSHALHRALFPLQCRDGRTMLQDVLVRQFGSGSEVYCLIQVKDATERRHTQEVLAQSRAQYRAAFDNAAIGICEVDPMGRFVRVNDRLCSILGYTEGELLTRRFHDITCSEDLVASVTRFQQLFKRELSSFSIEKRYVRKDGSLVWGQLTCSAVPGPDGEPILAIGTIEDISQRKLVEAEREQLLQQKDLLLREVHHRVKNSLALVASLLAIQNRKIGDPTARVHLADAYRRVLAIAQVHERLYQESQTDRVKLGPFLTDLCADLERSVMALERGQQVSVVTEAEVDVPFDKALPLAMIISELVTNAFKHAQPDGAPGKVVVHCEQTIDSRLRLSVSDNGVGLPKDFDPADSHGLGMRIITGLSQQLRASLVARNAGAGAEFILDIEI